MSRFTDPTGLTLRARTYMGIVSMRHLLIGAFCLIRPGDFQSPSYGGVKDALGFLAPDTALMVYGLAFIIAGVASAVPVVTGGDGAARAGLLISVVVTGLWVGGFFAAIWDGTIAGPTGPVVWCAVLAKDLTMLREPLRNPFEPIVRRIAAERRG